MIEERPLYSEWAQKNAKIAKTAKEKRTYDVFLTDFL
jgi:hypothetical protein